MLHESRIPFRTLKKIIAFSGLDSAGKSTQILLLEKYFLDKKNKVKVIWSRGGYTPLFNSLKNILRKSGRNVIPPPDESKQRDKTFGKKWVRVLWLNIALIDMILFYCLYFRLLKMLGYTIIADRYLWDTHIDFKLKFSEENFEKIILWKILAQLSPVPNYSIILTIPSGESIRRSNIKNEPFSENLNQRKERLSHYQGLIEKGKWDYVVDGLQPIDDVWAEIRGILR